MPALFLLLPAQSDHEALFATAAAPLREALAKTRMRRYPPATDGRHLLQLVRAGRDPTATRWLRGMVACVLGGALLGLATNGVLAGCFGMFGGLLEIALPLGLCVGAFLGGFTAAMTGTEAACDEVRSLAPHVRPGDMLLQVVATDGAPLDLLRTHCTAHGWPCVRRS